MAEKRELSGEYAAIATELINTEKELEYIKHSGVTIGYLTSDREKTSQGRTVYGECEKVPHKWKWSVPFDFVITIFEPNAERLNDEQKRILMFHELLHVGIINDGNEEIYSIVPHDIEDFKYIINRFGIDWNL
jgi:predicted metallopeptidase